MELYNRKVKAFYLFVFSFFLIAFGFTGTACSKNLTRSKAAALIEKSPQFIQIEEGVMFHRTGLGEGIQEGLWDDRKVIIPFGLNQNQRAINVFKGLNKDMILLSAQKTVKTKLSITGITDSLLGKSVKEADFNWEYIQGLSSFEKRFAEKGGIGKAYFKLYDDGWRLENLNIQHSFTPTSLSTEEIAEEEKDRKAWETEKQRLTKLLYESRIPHEHIGKFDFSFSSQGIDTSSDVTDAGITRARINGQPIDKAPFWFGDYADFVIVYQGSCGGYASIYVIYMMKPGLSNKTDGCTIVYNSVVRGDSVAVYTSKNEDDVTKVKELLSTALKNWQTKYSDATQYLWHTNVRF